METLFSDINVNKNWQKRSMIGALLDCKQGFMKKIKNLLYSTKFFYLRNLLYCSEKRVWEAKLNFND
jgi:hypothetical protein